MKAHVSACGLCMCVCLMEQRVKVRWWWRGAVLKADWARLKVRKRSDMLREIIWHPRMCVCVCVDVCVDVDRRRMEKKTHTKGTENGRVMCIRVLLTVLSWWKSRLIYWLTFSQSVPIHYRATECLWQQRRSVRSAARTADPHGDCDWVSHSV